jgi:hypothetical protein
MIVTLQINKVMGLCHSSNRHSGFLKDKYVKIGGSPAIFALIDDDVDVLGTQPIRSHLVSMANERSLCVYRACYDTRPGLGLFPAIIKWCNNGNTLIIETGVETYVFERIDTSVIIVSTLSSSRVYARVRAKHSVSYWVDKLSCATTEEKEELAPEFEKIIRFFSGKTPDVNTVVVHETTLSKKFKLEELSRYVSYTESLQEFFDEKPQSRTGGMTHKFTHLQNPVDFDNNIKIQSLTPAPTPTPTPAPTPTPTPTPAPTSANDDDTTTCPM